MSINAGTVILNKTGPGAAIGGPTTVASGATLQLAANGYASEIYSAAPPPSPSAAAASLT